MCRGCEAALEGARLRLRPILMTSFAFILGVVPLVLASGAGAEMRRALGLAVFSGMLGVTFFGIFLTPVFFYLLRRHSDRAEGGAKADEKRVLEMDRSCLTLFACLSCYSEFYRKWRGKWRALVTHSGDWNGSCSGHSTGPGRPR